MLNREELLEDIKANFTCTIWYQPMTQSGDTRRTIFVEVRSSILQVVGRMTKCLHFGLLEHFKGQQDLPAMQVSRQQERTSRRDRS